VLLVREFKPNDMFSVIKLASETLTERYNPSLFNYFYETFPEGFIVAEKNHKIIGFLIGVKMDFELAKILMLAVSKPYRKQKIGSELLNQFINKIHIENMKRIELEVRTNNNTAIEFYQKNGFKIKEKIKEFYQSGENAYTMLKEI
jgi:ribosomal-protein-alanine N-acetyltransferase